LIGCQPLDLEDWGGPLTEPVRATIDRALAAALEILAEWGITVEPRDGEIGPDDRLLANDIDFAAYERRIEA
jgi:hydrogenase maturation protease